MENTKLKTYSVEITRTAWSTETFEVGAFSSEEAESKALALAPDRAYGTDDGSDYSVESITEY